MIVSTTWPGEEQAGPGDRLRSARQLLEIINSTDDRSLAYVSVEVLREGLELTQPFRHGRADDEFATITSRHIAALEALDQHPGRNRGEPRGFATVAASFMSMAMRRANHKDLQRLKAILESA